MTNPQNFWFFFFFWLIHCVCTIFHLSGFFLQHQTSIFTFPSLDSKLLSTWLLSFSTFFYWKKFSWLRLLIARLLSGMLDFLVFSNHFDSFLLRIITSFLTWRVMVFKSLKKLMTTYTGEFYCLEALLTKHSCMTKICLAILPHTCDVLSLCLSSLSFNSIYKSNCSTVYTSHSALYYCTPVSVSF